MTNEELWQLALNEIELSISKANFITWLNDTRIVSNTDGRVVISVPNGFAKEWLENKYYTYILKALRNIQPEIKIASCIIATPKEDRSPIYHKESMMDAIIAPPRQEKPLEKKTFTVNSENNLNPKYTFENFIVGGNNELANAACMAVSENLGKIYNPLFIYGGVGLGKTHLIQSIGNKILEKNPAFRVKYITSERFTSDLISALQDKKINEFKEYYQKMDILIIDDIQFISGKEKTQEEFFHIFNHLYQFNKQIVLSSDRPPKSIQILEERLRSRFEGGMIADVSIPDLETRLGILKKKITDEKIEIYEDALLYIATNIKNNIRELEGALNRLFVSSQLTKKEITLNFTINQLSELISSGIKKGITCKQILKAVSDFYDIDQNDLILKNRKKEIVRPRQVAMYLLRSEINFSYPGIGEKLGGRDHTTAIHAFEKISKNLLIDVKLNEEITQIKNRLYRLE